MCKDKTACPIPTVDLSACSTAPLPKVKATLVVCPLVAVIQWRSEIARFTSPGSVKVLVYHGPKRNIDFEVLSQYDIVSPLSSPCYSFQPVNLEVLSRVSPCVFFSRFTSCRIYFTGLCVLMFRFKSGWKCTNRQ